MLSNLLNETITRLKSELEQIGTAQKMKQNELAEAMALLSLSRNLSHQPTISDYPTQKTRLQPQLSTIPLHSRVENALRAIGKPASPTDILNWFQLFDQDRLSGRARVRARTHIATAMERKRELFYKLNESSKWGLAEWLQ